MKEREFKFKRGSCPMCGGVIQIMDDDAPQLCGPECVRAEKIVSALNALAAKIDSLTAAPR